MSLTPEDSVILQHIGVVICGNIINLFNISVLYGIEILAYLFAASALLKRSRGRTKGTLAMFTLITVLLATSTMFTISNFVATLQLSRGIFLNNQATLDLESRAGIANNAVTTTLLVQSWQGNINLILADATVVWRVWALYRHPAIRVTASLFWVGFTTLALYNNIHSSVLGVEQDNRTAGDLGTSTSSFFMSFATNLVATLLISWKAWQHRQFLRNAGLTGSRSTVERILLILCESGTVYLILQLTVGVMVVLDQDLSTPLEDLDLATRFIGNCMAVISALYPTLIIALVALQKSLAHTPGIGTVSSSAMTDAHVEFSSADSNVAAIVSPHETTHNSRGSQQISSISRPRSILREPEDKANEKEQL